MPTKPKASQPKTSQKSIKEKKTDNKDKKTDNKDKNTDNKDKKTDNKDKKTDNKDKKKHKGGMKGADDPDLGSEDDYETDDQSNVEEEDSEEVVVAGKETNSDDDLEQKEESDEEVEESEEEPEEEQEEVQGDGEEGCIYRFTGNKKKQVDILAEFEAEDDFSEDDENVDTSKYVEPDKRITKNYMTIYERVRLLGERSKQLSLGAKPMIKNVENLNPKEVAKLELENKVMPLIVIRTLPNGLKEKWKVSELEIIN